MMEDFNILIGILRLLAGVGIFLTGCDIMSSNLEAASSDKLKRLLSKVSNNKIVGVLIGAAATIAIQSSSATTVMAIGFVNARIISLQQAATIIFGAEIGTTITGQLVALGMLGSSEISMDVIFSALAGLGVFVTMFSKRDNIRLIGNIMTGLGLLFAGLDTMSGAMSGFARYPQLKEFIAGLDSSFLLIIIGAVLTAIIQSSSAMTSISITMVAAGLINISQGIYLTLGANVGTCLTGMLAAAKADGVNARRTSLIQLLFNVGGVVLVYLSDLLLSLFSGGEITYGALFSKMFPGLPHTQLAMF
ncbi:MAG: Na/Pi cotransporter family protein, partial [Erysipelotrichaceae bacterium]|nr:Na/Pi cotransporter family protein [Erysipelotrichaceae bacterium]